MLFFHDNKRVFFLPNSRIKIDAQTFSGAKLLKIFGIRKYLREKY